MLIPDDVFIIVLLIKLTLVFFCDGNDSNNYNGSIGSSDFSGSNDSSDENKDKNKNQDKKYIYQWR